MPFFAVDRCYQVLTWGFCVRHLALDTSQSRITFNLAALARMGKSGRRGFAKSSSYRLADEIGRELWVCRVVVAQPAEFLAKEPSVVSVSLETTRRLGEVFEPSLQQGVMLEYVSRVFRAFVVVDFDSLHPFPAFPNSKAIIGCV